MNPQELISRVRGLLNNSNLRYIADRKVFLVDDDGNGYRIEFQVDGLIDGWISISYSKKHVGSTIWISSDGIEGDVRTYQSYEEFVERYKHYDFMKVLEEYSSIT
jgi:hypothetical protein